MSESAPLDDRLIAALESGAEEIVLPAGRYAAGVSLSRSVVIRGEPGEVVLVAPAGGPVLAVEVDGLDVRVEGVTLSGGHDDAGGGLRLRGFSQVHLSGCTVDDCRSWEGAGHAVYADAGDLTLDGCTLLAQGKGSVVQATGVASLALQRTAVRSVGGDALTARDEALVSCEQSELTSDVGAALRVAGSRSQRPEVSVRGGALRGAPAMALRARFPGKVRVTDTTLEGDVEGVAIPHGS